MAYITDKILEVEINSLVSKVDKNFAKKKDAIKSIELVQAIPTSEIGTSTELVNCLRLFYVDHETKTDINGDLIPHYVDISVEDLNGFKLRQWVTAEDYTINEYVVYDFKLYQVNQDITGDVDFDETKYNLIIGNNGVQLWEIGKDYKINDKVKYTDGNVYECIVDHTSADFDLEKDNWILLFDHYYNLSQTQYDDMVANGLITDDNKYLYIINDGSSPSSDNVYEETITTPNNIWSIQHNLDTDWYKLDITILDDTNSINYGDVDLDKTTTNLLVLNFTEPISGIIYIKK